MTTVLAKDYRKKSLSDTPEIEVAYDPAAIQEFDNRGKCPTKYQETWGQKVNIEIDGQPCVLFLELFFRSVNHVHQNRNIIKDC